MKEFGIERFAVTIEPNEIDMINAYLSSLVNRLTAFPQSIFFARSLTSLSLSHHYFEHIPGITEHMPRLSELNLKDCSRLESISERNGKGNLHNIVLTGCVSLKTPPQEVVKRGSKSVLAYLKRLLSGFKECKRTKLMLVGLGGAGKTRWGLGLGIGQKVLSSHV